MNSKILLLLVSSAVLALHYGGSVNAAAVTTPAATAAAPQTETALFDGVDLNLLSEEQLKALMDAKDLQLEADIDIIAYVNGVQNKPQRRKRWIPIVARAAFTVGRSLLRSFSRGGITRSGSRVTKHYSKTGNYRDAVRDFNKLRPSGVSNIKTPKLTGQTGTMGRHRVTVRSSSSNGSPTVEIRSPNANGGTTVRKFRYKPDHRQ